MPAGDLYDLLTLEERFEDGKLNILMCQEGRETN